MDLLAQMRWPQWSLALVLIAVCFLLMIVILLQRGRGGGLAGAFGGGGGSSAFGAKTGDVFTWITVVMAGAFVFLAVAANFVFDQSPKPDVVTPATVVPISPDTGNPIEFLPITVSPIEAVETKTQGDTASGTGTGAATPAADTPEPTPAGDTPGADSGNSPGTPKGEGADSDAGAGNDPPARKTDAPDRGDEGIPSP